MMISHSTLDCHVTFSTHSVAGSEKLFETLTGTFKTEFDPNPNPNPMVKKKKLSYRRHDLSLQWNNF